MVAIQSSRRERKKATVRTRIISEGIDLFSKRGISEVTVDEIAEAADVGKGTIYNYFAAKEDIVVAFMVVLEEKVQKRVPRLASSKGPLEAILTDYIRFQFRLKSPYHRFVRVFLAQMFSRTAEFLPYMVEMQKTIDPPLEALFQGLQRRGLVREDMHIPDVITTFKTIHMGLTALWAVEGPPFRETMKVLKHERKLFTEGLEKKI
jgi:AcrR family transcriptional regulator